MLSTWTPKFNPSTRLLQNSISKISQTSYQIIRDADQTNCYNIKLTDAGYRLCLASHESVLTSHEFIKYNMTSHKLTVMTVR